MSTKVAFNLSVYLLAGGNLISTNHVCGKGGKAASTTADNAHDVLDSSVSIITFIEIRC